MYCATLIFVFSSIFSSGVAYAQTTFDDVFQKANLAVVRLPPSEFPQLPTAIRQELNRRGCTIPQVWGQTNPHNVISGAFLQAAERDWAVLCSIHQISSILIFRNGLPANVTELARGEDYHRLQAEGGDQIGYSREITPISPKTILQYLAWGGEKNSRFLSIIRESKTVSSAKLQPFFYFGRGKWVCVAGAD